MSKGKDVAITQIVIKLGDVEVKMTPEAARELRDALNGMFRDSEIIITTPIPTIIPYPVPYPSPYQPYPRWYVETTCGGTTATLTASSTDVARLL